MARSLRLASVIASAAILLASTSPLPPMTSSAPSRPNIILIVLDTVRFDATSFAHPKQNNTPFLASLASHSVVFTNAFSTHDFTPPSHFSMLTGLRDGLGTDDDRPENALPWQLQRSGYQTFGMIANGLLAPEQMPTMRGFGQFNHYGDINGSSLDMIRDAGAIDMRLAMFQCRRTSRSRLQLFYSAERLLPRFSEEMQRVKRPYFGFINLLDAHEPYAPDPSTYTPETKLPPNFDGDVLNRQLPPELLHPETIKDPARRQLIEAKLRQVNLPSLVAADLSPEALAIYHRRYLANVNHLDSALRDFFDDLQEHHLLDNTIVIITSDHGESFGEAGFVTHMLNDHGDREATRHVPLLVVLPPGMHRNQAYVDRAVTLDMLAPTIYELAGIDSAPFARLHTGYAPSLIAFITKPPARVATAAPPPAAPQDHRAAENERTKTMKSLGYLQ